MRPEKYLTPFLRVTLCSPAISLGLEGWRGQKPRTKRRRSRDNYTNAKPDATEKHVTAALPRVTTWLSPKTHRLGLNTQTYRKPHRRGSCVNALTCPPPEWGKRGREGSTGTFVYVFK